MSAQLIKQVIIGGIAFIIIGMAMGFGPQMLVGFETMRNADNVSQYTGLATTIQMGPTLILLGFIISVGVVGFMGIKMSSGR